MWNLASMRTIPSSELKFICRTHPTIKVEMGFNPRIIEACEIFKLAKANNNRAPITADVRSTVNSLSILGNENIGPLSAQLINLIGETIYNDELASTMPLSMALRLPRSFIEFKLASELLISDLSDMFTYLGVAARVSSLSTDSLCWLVHQDRRLLSSLGIVGDSHIISGTTQSLMAMDSSLYNTPRTPRIPRFMIAFGHATRHGGCKSFLAVPPTALYEANALSRYIASYKRPGVDILSSTPHDPIGIGYLYREGVLRITDTLCIVPDSFTVGDTEGLRDSGSAARSSNLLTIVRALRPQGGLGYVTPIINVPADGPINYSDIHINFDQRSRDIIHREILTGTPNADIVRCTITSQLSSITSSTGNPNYRRVAANVVAMLSPMPGTADIPISRLTVRPDNIISAEEEEGNRPSRRGLEASTVDNTSLARRSAQEAAAAIEPFATYFNETVSVKRETTIRNTDRPHPLLQHRYSESDLNNKLSGCYAVINGKDLVVVRRVRLSSPTKATMDCYSILDPEGTTGILDGVNLTDSISFDIPKLGYIDLNFGAPLKGKLSSCVRVYRPHSRDNGARYKIAFHPSSVIIESPNNGEIGWIGHNVNSNIYQVLGDTDYTNRLIAYQLFHRVTNTYEEALSDIKNYLALSKSVGNSFALRYCSGSDKIYLYYLEWVIGEVSGDNAVQLYTDHFAVQVKNAGIPVLKDIILPK